MHLTSNALNEPAEGQLLALRFGPFELDVRSGELRRNGTTVRLQPQPLKVLLSLASRPGDVVTREELQAEVWPAGTFVDFEQSLNFCVRQIRSALGDNANAPHYVETLPRRGYRWVGGAVARVKAGPSVREWPRPVALEPRAAAEEAPTPPEAEGGPTPRPADVLRGPWLRRALLGVAFVAALAAVRWLPARPSAPAEPPTFQRVTFRRGAVSAARFGPGGQVVYTASWDGGERAVQVVGPEPRDARSLGIEGTVVGVSASGEVAFLRGGVLARAPLSGGPAKEVLKDVVAADWAADGGDLAVARSDEKGYRIELPVGRVIARVPRVGRVRLSPDGRHLAVTEHPTLDDDRGIVAIRDREGRKVAASGEWASLEGLAWSADGREVWLTASTVGADNAVHALSLDGRMRPVLSGMGRLVLHDVARDGRALLERATLRSEVLYRRAGEAEDRDLSWLDFSAVEGISPDGGTVFFYESGQGGGPGYSTFLRRADGSPPVRVGSGRALGLSADGAWVLSVSVAKPDHLDLAPTGPGETRRIAVPGLVAHEEAGFVGRDRLYATGRDAQGRRASWLVPLDGRAPSRLPLPEGRALLLNTFSADGSRFVCACPDGQKPCVFETDTGRSTPLAGVPKGWGVVGYDAQGRLYLRDRTRRMPETLHRLDPATGRTTLVAELAPRDRAGALAVLGIQVAAGGEAWAYSVMRRLSDLHVVTGVQ
jgi:DNA-binding winged helix-turn-helix (wHTH) protein